MSFIALCNPDICPPVTECGSLFVVYAHYWVPVEAREPEVLHSYRLIESVVELTHPYCSIRIGRHIVLNYILAA
jgi:hypothetical protein